MTFNRAAKGAPAGIHLCPREERFAQVPLMDLLRESRIATQAKDSQANSSCEQRKADLLKEDLKRCLGQMKELLRQAEKLKLNTPAESPGPAQGHRRVANHESVTGGYPYLRGNTGFSPVSRIRPCSTGYEELRTSSKQRPASTSRVISKERPDAHGSGSSRSSSKHVPETRASPRAVHLRNQVRAILAEDYNVGRTPSRIARDQGRASEVKFVVRGR